ncbi:6-pyruvoyl trahydropterin synthase family protein [Frankia sp. Cr1]|uniref:6-pyruvoyl trahydropterin synthase family protein n=1 Tax=Frankia sp. Cr1 TaxID=3073931 RepID=UPI002AD2915B|nr:6-carboxytetrahydropterin synthase [Frankia sp. Cr1]
MPTTTAEIGRGAFDFSAGHTGLHDGEFEHLHGHTYQVVVRLTGFLDSAGMIMDFTDVKAAVRRTIAPLKGRVLLAGQVTPPISVDTTEGVVTVTSSTKRYVFPEQDVVVLPIANTTTEALADHLLDGVLRNLRDGDRRLVGGLRVIELELFEAPDTSATVRADLGRAGEQDGR